MKALNSSKIPLIATFLVSSVMLGGCGAVNEIANPLSRPSAAPQPSNQVQRKDPLAGVYHPSRLHVISTCKTVSGVVERVKREPDHDFHINLKVDSQYSNLLRSGNFKHEHGDLVVEIIPMDQPYIPRPKIGQHITVTGAYVIDGVHGGWSEIHPAWLVDGKGSVNYTAATAAKSVQTGIEGNKSYFGKIKDTGSESE